MNDAAISARDVWRYFGDFPAIRGVTLDIFRGSILALLGRNGAGKTTLLRMVAGLLRPSKGKIQIHSKDGGRSAPGASIGVVGHGEWIYDDLTAEENLRFFARLYEVENPEETIERWIETVGLSAFRNARANEYSRGMRQRLAVARAFLHDPQVLLMDEPWSALDDRAIRLLSSLLVDAHAQQRTVVVCSHQLREALEIATDVAVIERGKLIFQGKNTDDLRSSPEDFYQKVS